MKYALLLGLGIVAVGVATNMEPSRKVTISGRVTHRGRPLADGLMILVPVSETSGQQVAARVEQGRYAFVDEHGALPGAYLVEIHETGVPSENAPIPAEFNTKTRLRLSVPEDKRLTAEFDL